MKTPHDTDNQPHAENNQAAGRGSHLPRLVRGLLFQSALRQYHSLEEYADALDGKPNNGWWGKFVRLALECRHEWDVTGCNGFGTPTEDQCEKCGMYRHRILKAENLHEDPKWRMGRHPNSSANDPAMASPPLTTPKQ